MTDPIRWANWKLKPHQWGSAALYLYISVDPPSKGSVSDSIWLTDGLTYIWVPQISSTAKVTFQVPLASVQSGMHYFFTDVKGDPCDEVVIGTTDQILTIDNFTDLGGLTARIMNYQSGLMIDEPLTNHLERPIERGQYQVWVLDPDGQSSSRARGARWRIRPSERSAPLAFAQALTQPNTCRRLHATRH